MRRFVVYFVGLNLLALGIVLNISTNLGVAALSSSIYATSVIFSLSLGTASIIWYLLFVAVQCILTGKIKREFLLEIPLSFAFGFLNDFYDRLLHITPCSAVQSGFLLLIAVACISMGVFLTSKTELVLNPGDGMVRTISRVFQKPFYMTKNCFDISMILASLALSAATGNPVLGIGAGTIISALFTGRFIKWWDRLFGEKVLGYMQLETKF